MRRLGGILIGSGAVLLLGTIPVTASPERGLTITQACAQVDEPTVGTCCWEPPSICVIGQHAFRDYYYKASGPCVRPGS